MRDLPLLDGVLRHRFVFLGAVAVLFWVGGAQSLTEANDWQYFTWGSDQLRGIHHPFPRPELQEPGTAPGGLSTYASYPFLQIGPPALAAAALLQVGPRDGLYVAGAVVQLLGLLSLALVERATTSDDRRSRLCTLSGGTLFLVVWGSLTHFTHLDDAITLTAIAGAGVVLRSQRAVPTGLLLGLAAASKPWGVAAVGLAMALPRARDRALAVAVAAVVVLACWGPFVLADLDTLRLGDVGLPVDTTSALSALGVDQVGRPSGLRLLQLAGGLVVAALLARRSWPAALLAAFSLRLLVEPSAYQYYAAAAVLAALATDLARWRAPVLTAALTAGWFAVPHLDDGPAATTRAASYGVGLAVAVVLASRGQDLSARSGPSSRPGPQAAEAAPRPPSGTG